MNTFDNQAATLRRRYDRWGDGISRLILHLAEQLESIVVAEDRQDQHSRRHHELLMQIKVLELIHLTLHSHAEMPSVTLDRYSELEGMQVMRGVFSPEFATDSYLWANYIAQRGLVDGKSVLEMGAGSGVISLRRSSPRRTPSAARPAGSSSASAGSASRRRERRPWRSRCSPWECAGRSRRRSA